MILSDYSIRESIEQGRIVVTPELEEIQYQPASLDLRCGDEWTHYTAPGHVPWYEEGLIVRDQNLHHDLIDPEKDVTKYMRHRRTDEFILGKQCFVLGTTLERIEMPSDIVGRIEGRSSLGRLGLMVHITAGFIDPGFKGQITLEFFNASNRPIIIRKGKRICQLSFETMTCAAREPYGTKKGSKYQDQGGAVPSRIHKDV